MLAESDGAFAASDGADGAPSSRAGADKFGLQKMLLPELIFLKKNERALAAVAGCSGGQVFLLFSWRGRGGFVALFCGEGGEGF